MKSLLYLTFFSFFGLIAQLISPSSAKGEEVAVTESILLRIKQNSVPYQTISLELNEEMSWDSGKTFITRSTYSFKHIRKKSLLVVKSQPVGEKGLVSDFSKMYFDGKTFTTEKNLVVPPDVKKILRQYATISDKEEDMPKIAELLVNIGGVDCMGQLSYFCPLFQNGKLMGYKPSVSYIVKDGKKMVEIRNEPPKQMGMSFFILRFDAETGLLREKFAMIWGKDGDTLKEEVSHGMTISEYFNQNGFYFPKIFLWHGWDGKNIGRYTINTDSLKINEKIDEKEFVYVFPPNIEVHDKIRGISYRASSIGTAGGEEKMAKELDEYFKKMPK